MNVSDSEIVTAILKGEGYVPVKKPEEADLVLVNTCSIRENAEQRVRKRLSQFHALRKKNKQVMVGLLGCMAEQIKTRLFDEESVIDLIAGPDAYRDLPSLIRLAGTGQKSVNVLLSAEETYGDIAPVRMDENGVSAFISIMRGCENFCSYCVVPNTRGKERSRDTQSILREAGELVSKGYKEVTLLGQNVNSYRWITGETALTFAALVKQVASVSPLLRVRFATSHPKDISDELLHVIASHENICKAIHLPVQSGSNAVLKKMNRKYTREQYMERLDAIRRIIPGCAISTDIITGFCGETENDHRETLTLMQEAAFDAAYMFAYSERPGTAAAKRFEDDIPAKVKQRRLNEIIERERELSLRSNLKEVGTVVQVLTESFSKRSKQYLAGRSSQNKVVVFPAYGHTFGDIVRVRITSCTAATLIGEQA